LRPWTTGPLDWPAGPAYRNLAGGLAAWRAEVLTPVAPAGGSLDEGRGRSAWGDARKDGISNLVIRHWRTSAIDVYSIMVLVETPVFTRQVLAELEDDEYRVLQL
jgi:hypothetical protein